MVFIVSITNEIKKGKKLNWLENKLKYDFHVS